MFFITGSFFDICPTLQCTTRLENCYFYIQHHRHQYHISLTVLILALHLQPHFRDITPFIRVYFLFLFLFYFLVCYIYLFTSMLCWFSLDCSVFSDGKKWKWESFNIACIHTGQQLLYFSIIPCTSRECTYISKMIRGQYICCSLFNLKYPHMQIGELVMTVCMSSGSF